ncbi:MAG: BatA domain-containing protein [Gemmatimonadetes bacterium]|nr:BatA domain-containing protein [Gemmatimonadota bacterium]
MTWRAPLAFAGLVVLALPVLVHLLSRRPARALAFPSLRFLATATLTATRRTRLSDIPLLLVRVATLAMAVVALAQPARDDAASPTGATALLVPAAATGVDTVWSPPDQTGAMDAVRVMRGAPDVLLDGAIGWLRTQPAPRRVVVRGPVPRGVLDSARIAALPRDVALSFEPMREVAPTRPVADTIAWVTTLDGETTVRVVMAVAARTGVVVRTVREVRGVSAQDRAVVSAWAPSSAAGDTLATGTDAASALELARRVAGDAALRDVLSTMTADTTAAATAAGAGGRATGPGVLLRADARGHAILSFHVRGAGERAQPWFHLQVPAPRVGPSASVASAPAAATAALALLRAIAETQDALRAREATAPEATNVLTRLAAMPAGAPIGAAVAVPDVHRGATWARYGWLLVLLLLGVETWMRRRPAASAPERVA